MSKFFVGQKVKITMNLSNHAHKIGEVVVLDKIINEYQMKSAEGWWFSKNECEPYCFTKEELKLERYKLTLEEIANTPMVKGIGSLENLYNGLILRAKEVLEEK